MGTTDPVAAFLAGIEAADLPEDIFCEDVVLDATVPNWRFQRPRRRSRAGRAGEVVCRPRTLRESCAATAMDDGELVEFTLDWEEAGVPHACHQAHVIRLRDNRISSDSVFCGGRWPEPLLAQMEEAQRTVDRNAVPGSS